MSWFSKKTRKNLKKYSFVYVLLTPVLLYFLIFSYGPLFMGVVQSFQSSQLMGDIDWVGFSNYQQVISDQGFIRSLWNGFLISGGTLVGSLFLALLIALGLNELRNAFSKSTIQTASYLPYLFSWTVVGGIWVFLLSPNGFLNGVIQSLGGDRMMFMTRSSFARWIMIGTGIWKTVGYHAVLFIAAIMSINPHLFEAAQIDGASREKQIRKIIVPDILPTLKVLVILGMMGLFTNFDQILVMGNPAIIDRIRTPMFYVYEQGIERFNMGLATAAAVIVMLLTIVVTAVVSKLISGKWRAR
jgi:putative aldouronate transport system permease protein